METDATVDDAGAYSFMMQEPTDTTDAANGGCAEDAKEFDMYVKGAFELLAAPADATVEENMPAEEGSGPDTYNTPGRRLLNQVELLEFADVQEHADSKKTTHYRRETHEDGSATIHRRTSIQFAEDPLPAPFLLQQSTDASSLTSLGSYVSTLDNQNSVKKTTGSSDTRIGGSQQGSSTSGVLLQEGTCESPCVVDSEVDWEGQEVVMEQEVVIAIERIDTEELLQQEPYEQFLQRHQAAGRVPVPMHVVTSRIRTKKQPEPVNADEGMASFVEYLEAAPASEYAKSQTKDRLEKTMQSQQIRKRVVALIQDGAIRNDRAVQALMHVIGRVGRDDSTALTQLIQMASNEKVKSAARQQALMALVQSKCYDHDHAIRGLSDLTRDPKSDVELMAVHVKYGLIGHAEHCAHGAYRKADNYRMLLQEAQRHLTSALNSGDEHAANVWLTAIGNSNSQHADDTAAVAAAAHHEKFSPAVRMYAIQALGKLFTPAARQHLSSIAADSTDSFLQSHADKALRGEQLLKGDKRLAMAKSGMVTELAQTTARAGEMAITREKVWPLPSSGDLRAEPKIGVAIYKNDADKYCLHGYAGVDGKAWTWTVSLIQAGGEKCQSTAFRKYIAILGITVWPGSSAGSTMPQIAQFSQAGDSNGKCSMNVDAADLVVTMAYDWTFFEYDKTFSVCGVPINGLIKLEGEIGIKVGWGALGDPNIGSDAPAQCASGKIVFSIPYAQASLTGELSLDLAVVKGGVGINVLLVKFSMPNTAEEMTGGTSEVSCGGTYLKAETMGGRIYGFLDRLSAIEVEVTGCCWWAFWTWEIRREWARVGEITLYEWSSPADWTSNEVSCNPDNLSEPEVESPSVSAPVDGGAKYSLKGGNHQRYCADEGNVVKCNRGHVLGWEKFELHPQADMTFALKGGKDGRWCADEINTIKCNRNAIGQWEKFTLSSQGNDVYGLRGGQSGRWCADEGDSGVKCNRNALQGWEKFTVAQA